MTRYAVFAPIIHTPPSDTVIQFARALDEHSTRVVAEAATYQPIAHGVVDAPHGYLDEATTSDILEQIYTRHNDSAGGTRSVSKGDIVTIDEAGGSWLCWAFGWAGLGGYEADRFPVDAAGPVPASTEGAEARTRTRARFEAMRTIGR